MILSGVCSSFLLELTQGVHTAGDVYRMALYTREAELTQDTTLYTTAKEVLGMGYGAGGMTLTGYRAFLEAGVVLMTWANPVWPHATFTARAGLIYNYSKGNRAVAVMDFREDITCTNGPFTIYLPEATLETALIRIG